MGVRVEMEWKQHFSAGSDFMPCRFSFFSSVRWAWLQQLSTLVGFVARSFGRCRGIVLAEKEADRRADAGRHEKVGSSCIAGAAALWTEMTTPASSTTTTQAHGADRCAQAQSQSGRQALLL